MILLSLIIFLFMMYLFLISPYKLRTDFEALTMKSISGLITYSAKHEDITSYTKEEGEYYIQTRDGRKLRIGNCTDNKIQTLQSYTFRNLKKQGAIAACRVLRRM